MYAKKLETWFDDLFPLHRSLTGDGNRETLRYIHDQGLDLDMHQIASGEKIYDWFVPKEWCLSEAFVENADGKRIIDAKVNPLSVVQYSMPFEGVIDERYLLEHLHFIKDLPDAIPYRTSFYHENWGFCCSYNLVRDSKFKGPFRVKIDSELKEDGHLVWAEKFFRGKQKKEIIISTYICHPNLANDNLSGIITTMALIDHLSKLKSLNYSYRFIFCPETIGALVFLSRHKEIKNIAGGTIVTNTGGPGEFSLKQSFDKESFVNKALIIAAKTILKDDFRLVDFVPDGSDERQYSKPAFRINTPSMHKSKYYDFKEYHTSLDNKSIIDFCGLMQIVKIYEKWFEILEADCTPQFIENHGEINLGRRGLYPQIGGEFNQEGCSSPVAISAGQKFKIISWMMHHFDGTLSLIDFCSRTNLPFDEVKTTLHELDNKGCLCYE